MRSAPGKNLAAAAASASAVAVAAIAATAFDAAECDGAEQQVKQEPQQQQASFFAKLFGPRTESEGNRRKARLQRTASEGIQRRDLIVCGGGQAELASQYEIMGRLGRGGFGMVRKAKHRITGMMRAVKTIVAGEDEDGNPIDLISNSQWVKIMAEVEALMALDHPNIVRLYEYYKDGHALYLIEEYCSGGTLEARIEASPRGRFTADDAAVALRQMLRGLVCCHAHGLAHRDLKPDNFVYGSRDPSSSLKMIDFGLSFNLGPDKLAGGLSSANEDYKVPAAAAYRARGAPLLSAPLLSAPLLSAPSADGTRSVPACFSSTRSM